MLQMRNHSVPPVVRGGQVLDGGVHLQRGEPQPGQRGESDRKGQQVGALELREVLGPVVANLRPEDFTERFIHVDYFTLEEQNALLVKHHQPRQAAHAQGLLRDTPKAQSRIPQVGNWNSNILTLFRVLLGNWVAVDINSFFLAQKQTTSIDYLAQH
jgi:hypothetical protein